MTKLSLVCPHCGGDQFIHPSDSNLQSKITCNGCKRVFLASDLAKTTAARQSNTPATRQKAERLAAEAARAAFGKMLK